MSNTDTIYEDYVDNRIKRVQISNKGFGMIAFKKIPKNTIIIKETPAFCLDSSEKIYSDIFQLLYKIFTADIRKIRRFLNFQPKTTKNFQHHHIAIGKELDKLKNTNYHHIYTFFRENYSDDEILLFCAKYMCNAFEPSTILFLGAQLNHSCSPNVIFYWNKKQMYFKTIHDIEAGEEICDNYVDITQNYQTRHKRLKDQYGFICHD